MYITEENAIYATRGDVVLLSVSAEDEGKRYTFVPGDVVRFKVYGKKDAENVVLQKDFPVTDETSEVQIVLTEEDTKIGEVISKPKDYWYEVELNPFSFPQTIIGYDEDGPKLFRLFPEGADIPEKEYTKEELPLVDTELDMTSARPVENGAIARAFTALQAKVSDAYNAVAKIHVTPQMFGAVGDGVADDTDAIQSAIEAAKRVNGATVFLPAGIYKTSAPLTIYSHTRLLGSGKRGKSDEGYSGTHIQYEGDASESIVKADGGYGIEIKDIRVSGTAARGISLVGVSECALEHVNVNGGCGIGLYFEGTITRLDNLYMCGNEVGVALKNCHGVTVSNLNAWANPTAGIRINGNGANIHIENSWIENSLAGVLFDGDLVCYGVSIDNTSFTAGSEYSGARFISADYDLDNQNGTALLQGLDVRSCVVKINNPVYGVYINTPTHNTIATFECCTFLASNKYTAAIYSANKYNRFFIRDIICEDYSAVQYDVFGGLGNKLEVNIKGAYTEVEQGRPLKLSPLSAGLENYTEGQFYYKDGRLMLTDGTKTNAIPIQGEAIYGVSVNDVTLPALAQKVNDLLVLLRNCSVIK